MNVAILIATCGDEAWSDLAWSRAYPSAIQQGCPVIVYHSPAGTVAEARNHAASLTEADWLCFLDADDELEKGYVDAMTAVEGPTSILVAALLAPAVQYVREGAPIGRPAVPSRGRWPDLNECVIGTLVERRLFEHVGGFRELPSLEDWDLWLRCYIAGAEIRHVPEAVYCAHMSAGSRNSDQSTYDEIRAANIRAWSM